MSTESERKFEDLAIKDDQVAAAQIRLMQMLRDGEISSQSFQIAKERLQQTQDRLAVQMDLVNGNTPLINVPTDEELKALRQQVVDVEQKIAAAATAEGLLSLVNSIAGEPSSNA